LKGRGFSRADAANKVQGTLATKTLTNFPYITARGIAVDAAGNVYCTVFATPVVTFSVDVFSADASGSASPQQAITSAAWTSSDDVLLIIR
jgi:hypothetical protein